MRREAAQRGVGLMLIESMIVLDESTPVFGDGVAWRCGKPYRSKSAAVVTRKAYLSSHQVKLR